MQPQHSSSRTLSSPQKETPNPLSSRPGLCLTLPDTPVLLQYDQKHGDGRKMSKQWSKHCFVVKPHLPREPKPTPTMPTATTGPFLSSTPGPVLTASPGGWAGGRFALSTPFSEIWGYDHLLCKRKPRYREAVTGPTDEGAGLQRQTSSAHLLASFLLCGLGLVNCPPWAWILATVKGSNGGGGSERVPLTPRRTRCC